MGCGSSVLSGVGSSSDTTDASNGHGKFTSLPLQSPMKSSTGFIYKGIKEGLIVLCKDEFVSRFTKEPMSRWRRSEIKMLTEDDRSRVRIHYIDWSDSFDFWLDLRTDWRRLAPVELLSKNQCDLGLSLNEEQERITMNFLLTGKFRRNPPPLASSVNKTVPTDTSTNVSTPPQQQQQQQQPAITMSQKAPSFRREVNGNINTEVRGTTAHSEAFSHDQSASLTAQQQQEAVAYAHVPYFHVGQLLDVQDVFYKKGSDRPLFKWRKASVLKVTAPGNAAENGFGYASQSIRIHYLDWDSRFDETLHTVKDADRLSCFDTMTSASETAKLRSRLPQFGLPTASSEEARLALGGGGAQKINSDCANTHSSAHAPLSTVAGKPVTSSPASSLAPIVVDHSMPPTAKRRSSFDNRSTHSSAAQTKAQNGSNHTGNNPHSAASNASVLRKNSLSTPALSVGASTGKPQPGTDGCSSPRKSSVLATIKATFGSASTGATEPTVVSAVAATSTCTAVPASPSSSSSGKRSPKSATGSRITSGKYFSDWMAKITRRNGAADTDLETQEAAELAQAVAQSQEEQQVRAAEEAVHAEREAADMARDQEEAEQEAAMERRFLETMERRGLHVVPIEGDGNCLFRAVSHQLYLTEDRHEELRARCVKHLQQHKERFEMFCSDNFEEHIAELARPGTWGDDLEIRALEEICDRVICIYQSDSVQQQVLAGFTGTGGGSGSGCGPSGQDDDLAEAAAASLLSADSEAVDWSVTAPIRTNFEEDALLRGVSPISLSYHGQNHYNSVYNVKIALPLETRTSRTLMKARMALFQCSGGDLDSSPHREVQSSPPGGSGFSSGGGSNSYSTDRYLLGGGSPNRDSDPRKHTGVDGRSPYSRGSSSTSMGSASRDALYRGHSSHKVSGGSSTRPGGHGNSSYVDDEYRRQMAFVGSPHTFRRK